MPGGETSQQPDEPDASTTDVARTPDRRRRRPIAFAFLPLLVGVAVGVPLIAWTRLSPPTAPVEALTDPRDLVGWMSLLTGALASGVWLSLTVGSSVRPPRRRRAVWTVAGGAAASYGACLAGLLAVAGGSDAATLDALVAFAIGIGAATAAGFGVAAVLIGTGGWGSAAALPVSLAGTWSLAVLAAIGDVIWMLSGPQIAPFTPCGSGMDCVGKDPTTLLQAGLVTFGAVFWWVCLAAMQLFVIVVGWLSRTARVRRQQRSLLR